MNPHAAARARRRLARSRLTHSMDAVASAVISIAFHGLAYAMVLYLVSVGLSVTMGLMGFVNLAHGVFAVAGGYVTLTLMNRLGVPFPSRWRSALIAVGAIGVVLERTALSPALRRRRARPGAVHHRPHLHVGGGRASCSGARWRSRCSRPTYLSGQIDLGFRDFPGLSQLPHRRQAPSLVTLLWLGSSARVRRADPRRRRQPAHGAVDRHQHQPALHPDLRARQRRWRRWAARSAPTSWRSIPDYALEHLVYFLIVVAVGGLGSIRGPFVAALLLGIADTACKYLLPEFGAFFIYAADPGDPAVAAARPVRARADDAAPPLRGHRPPPIEALARRPSAAPLELAAVAAWPIACLLPASPTISRSGAQILIMILFALSLDLILGYAGIVTLGQPRSSASAPIPPGSSRAHGWAEPLSGLVAAGVVAGARRLRHRR